MDVSPSRGRNRYSSWDSLRIWVASLIVGKALWGKLSEDLERIYVGAHRERRDA